MKIKLNNKEKMYEFFNYKNKIFNNYLFIIFFLIIFVFKIMIIIMLKFFACKKYNLLQCAFSAYLVINIKKNLYNL